ncbi:hypothetical protein DENSPDRAFT_934411 [Dentipellis sp. KUC8613]|nr:hypothetical protein DENSPDRAFT_934411 [Dentipellis sp. KUC8613]
MTVSNVHHASAPSENWDDDFLFQQGNDANGNAKQRNVSAGDPRQSTSSSAWESEASPRRSKSSPHAEEPSSIDPVMASAKFQEWADPGPSTPPKRHLAQAENWDDDFEDKTDSPVSPSRRQARRGESTRQQQAAKLPQVAQEPENWDDDFELDKANSPPRNGAWSSDDDDGLGFADQEEDRTVTARSRRNMALKQASPPPPVPPLPASLTAGITEPFPGSPNLSVFSVPSGRDSVAYSSMAHLPLRTGSNSALGMLPPSPPIHKERRRLRKKSRPPDSNVFELLDRSRDEQSAPAPLASTSHDPPAPPLPSPDQSPPTKTPLLSRIGSVKRWGGRKKRSSTSPADIVLNEMDANKDATPRPASRTSDAHQNQSQTHSPSSKHSSWFFRSSGGVGAESPPALAAMELKHEKSIDRLRSIAAVQDSPTRMGKKRASVMNFRPTSSGSQGSTPDGTPPPSPGRPKRPSSMQVPPGRTLFPRHTSHGAMTLGRSTSRSTFATSTDDLSKEVKGESEKNKEEGHRSFMGGMRRISLATGSKKHKRTKSSAAQEKEMLPSPEPPISALLPPVAGEVTRSLSEELLPPIELQPPSPPRVTKGNGHVLAASESDAIPAIESLLLRPSTEVPPSQISQLSHNSHTSTSTLTPRASPTKPPGSPQSASLGRTTQPPPAVPTNTNVPRRNSLGDLKIPARISQAQVGLKRDLGMVRDFASSVDKLKELQGTYEVLVREIQAVIAEHSRPPSRATSPTFFSIPRPRSRARSNTNPTASHDTSKQFATAFYTIDAKYKISWECAELLIELGGGNPAPMSPPSSTTSAPTPDVGVDSISSRKSRERAVTLAGDESKPPFASHPGPPIASPPNLGWRASTGRNDLSQRQLWLLRDMLNNADSSASMAADSQIPEDMPINRTWHWGDPMSSTITLPSEESMQNASPSKKRRSSRLGMSGLRDMLKSLTRSNHQRQPPFQSSSASASADSSLDSHGQPRNLPSVGHSSQRRQSKTSTGPESIASIRAISPFNTSASYTHKLSPRRPSLASIFRFAQKSKSSMNDSEHSDLPKSTSHPSSSGSDLGSRLTPDDDEDWDRIESVEDLDAAAKALGVSRDGLATVRGRKARSPYLHAKHGDPITPKKGAAASQSSLSVKGDSPLQTPARLAAMGSSQIPLSAVPPLPSIRPTRLSNVEEAVEPEHRSSRTKGKRSNSKSRTQVPSPSPHRPTSGKGSRRGMMTGSVRSAPPPSLIAGYSEGLLHQNDPKLAMTPENIRPLLENAREVQARCVDCIGELRLLLAARGGVS